MKTLTDVLVFGTLLESIAKFFYWLFGKVAAWVVSLFMLIQSWAQAAVESLFTSVLPHVFPAVNWSAWTAYLAKLNYFLPFSEGVVAASGLIFLWIAVALYRVVKSYFPTVSS